VNHTFGAALRALRHARGLSTRALARLANCSPAAVGHAETGARLPSPELAGALDQALGSAPLLVTLLNAHPGDDDVDRRTLLGQVIAVGGLTAAAGPGALADTVHDELSSALDGHDEQPWDAVVARHSRTIINTPAPALEVHVLADLALARQGVARGDRDATRAAAHLALLYGQCRADRADPGTAARWYDIAVKAADKAADTTAAVFIRARQAVRLNYEGGPDQALFGAAQHGLALSATPSIGALECHVALAAASARRGDAEQARASMQAYTDLAGQVDADAETGFDPVARVLYSRTYVLSRVGDLVELDRACQAAQAGALPAIWAAQARLNLAYGLARAGDGTEGVRQAAAVVTQMPRQHRTRIFGQMITDLVSVLPPQRRTRDDVRALRSLTKGTPQ